MSGERRPRVARPGGEQLATIARMTPNIRQAVRGRRAARQSDASRRLGCRTPGVLCYESSAVMDGFPVARTGALVDVTNDRSSRAATPGPVQRSRWQVHISMSHTPRAPRPRPPWKHSMPLRSTAYRPSTRGWLCSSSARLTFLPWGTHQWGKQSRTARSSQAFSSTSSTPCSMKRRRLPSKDVYVTTATRARTCSRSDLRICRVAPSRSSTGIWISIRLAGISHGATPCWATRPE